MIKEKEINKYIELMRIFFLMLYGLLSLSLFSQSTTPSGFPAPTIFSKSPEAAAFLKYGEYPVDLATGVPGVSIPLYAIETKSFKLPISLEYHASGIKVNQDATWVGLGWNLNCGAQVILSPRDGIDENNPYVDDIPDDNAILAYWKDHPYQHNGGVLTSQHLDESRVKDVYSFSSPTISGNFYIKKISSNPADNVVVIFPSDAFKVELLGISRSNMGFKITDVVGNTYLFNNTKEVSVRTLTHDDTYTSAWYVDEIKTPTNESITFTYQNDGTFYEFSKSQSVEVSRYCNSCGSPCDGYYQEGSKIGAVKEEGSITITTSKKIKEIVFNQGKSKVIFEKIDGREDLLNRNGYLSNIKVQQLKGAQYETIKGFSFEYTYFDANDNINTTAYNKKRLKLNRVIDFISGDGHEFVYSTIALPSKVSTAQDYYGYYNGVGNGDLIPIHFLTNPSVGVVGSANREVSPSLNQAGILKEIHYPTKGWTKFNYETNQYYGIDLFDKYKLHIVNSNVVQGTGVASVPADEFQNITYLEIPYQAINGQGQLTFQMNNPVGNDPTLVKHQYARVMVYDGSIVKYDSGPLKETRPYTIPLSSLQSGTISIEAYGCYMSIIGLQLKYVNNDPNPKNNYGSGLRVASIENYNHNNSLLLKKEYDYSDITNSTITSGKLINDLSTSFISNSFKNINFSSCGCDKCLCVPIYSSQDIYTISSNSRYGIEGNSIVYRYVKERQINSIDGTKNGYTQYEFTTDADESPLGNPTVQIYTSWKRGKVLEKSDYKSMGNTNYLVRNEKNTYFEDNSKISYINGFKMFRNGTSNIVEYSPNPLLVMCPFNAYGDYKVTQVFEPITFNLPVPWFYLKNTVVKENFFDSSNAITGTITTTKIFKYNNPIHQQLSSQTSVSSLGEAIETKYYYPQDNEMISEPCASAMIAKNMIGIPLDTQTLRAGQKISEQKTVYGNDATTSNLILPKYVYNRKGVDTNSALDKKITYDSYDTNGAILQYTLESSIPVSIIWGYNKTQPIAKIENATYSAVSSYVANLQTLSDTGTEDNLLATLTTLRNSLPNAMVTTYTYKPLVGISTITDPKGNTTYYEYDELNRLKLVKDAQKNILSENQYHYKN